jgi:hydrogenase nickel incorporation protein HypA/HybF
MGYEYYLYGMYIAKLMEILMDWSKKNDVEKILEVHLEVGEFAMTKPINVRSCLKLLSKGTIADSARFFVKKIPGVMSCKKCGYIGKAKKIYYVRMGIYTPSTKCPKCNEVALEVVQGKEYILRKIKFKRKGSELPEEISYEG